MHALARKSRRQALKAKIKRAKLVLALKSRQFWMVFSMSSLSICKYLLVVPYHFVVVFGYYTIDIFKVFG